jgi:hypothetical protein
VVGRYSAPGRRRPLTRKRLARTARLGIAEVDQRAVAQVLGDEPSETLNSLRHTLLIGRNDPLRSSGSMRADSAVEPTKSENITVTWRRSARSSGEALGALGVVAASADEALLPVSPRSSSERPGEGLEQRRGLESARGRQHATVPLTP